MLVCEKQIRFKIDRFDYLSTYLLNSNSLLVTIHHNNVSNWCTYIITKQAQSQLTMQPIENVRVLSFTKNCGELIVAINRNDELFRKLYEQNTHFIIIPAMQICQFITDKCAIMVNEHFNSLHSVQVKQTDLQKYSFLKKCYNDRFYSNLHVLSSKYVLITSSLQRPPDGININIQLYDVYHQCAVRLWNKRRIVFNNKIFKINDNCFLNANYDQIENTSTLYLYDIRMSGVTAIIGSSFHPNILSTALNWTNSQGTPNYEILCKIDENQIISAIGFKGYSLNLPYLIDLRKQFSVEPLGCSQGNLMHHLRNFNCENNSIWSVEKQYQKFIFKWLQIRLNRIIRQ